MADMVPCSKCSRTSMECEHYVERLESHLREADSLVTYLLSLVVADRHRAHMRADEVMDGWPPIGYASDAASKPVPCEMCGDAPC